MMLFCDVETGGLDSATSDVIEIYAVLTDIDGNQNGEPFYSKVKPEKPVNPGAAKVNGYTLEKWADSISQQECWTSFNEWLKKNSDDGVMLVNWNPGFDMGFIKGHVTSIKLAYHPLDVLSMIWRYVRFEPPPPGRKYVDLSTAVRCCLESEIVGAHSAKGDVEACVDLYKWAVRGW